MAELRSVDPRLLQSNPDNPRRTPVPKEMDQQLTASISAIGLLQPPVGREIDGALVVRAGDRRVRAAIAAGKDAIDVYVLDGSENIDAMAAMSENLVRVSMNPVDTWRGIDKLEQAGWNEEAIAAALALPPRTVRKLKLLGKLHPPMLDIMAQGSMPNEDQLRAIANAPMDAQAQVWKKHKPKKGHAASWWDVARALSTPRIPFSAARFDDKLAEEYGVVWLDDLFAPAGEDGRHTVNAEGFFGAQQAWMAANLPDNGTILTQDDYGHPVLPKGAQSIWGKPGKQDKIGHYLDRSGEIKTVTYRMPEPKKAGKGGAADALAAAPAKERADVTQKGLAMIGDFRTDALHQALDNESVSDNTLIGLLVVALAASNVSVTSDHVYGLNQRTAIRDRIGDGGVITGDPSALRAAAREMLKLVLSCRTNMTNSGASSRIAGETLGASDLLPNMATDAFLSCLSRQALERSAVERGLKAEARVKDTRASLVAHCKDTTWRFPAALFALTAEERASAEAPSHRSVASNGNGTDANEADSEGAFKAADFDNDAGAHESNPHALAAE